MVLYTVSRLPQAGQRGLTFHDKRMKGRFIRCFAIKRCLHDRQIKSVVPSGDGGMSAFFTSYVVVLIAFYKKYTGQVLLLATFVLKQGCLLCGNAIG